MTNDIFKNTKVKVDGFTIRFTDIDTTFQPWANGQKVIHSRVTITDTNGYSIGFDFYGSVADYDAILKSKERNWNGTKRHVGLSERINRNKERHSEYNIIWAAYCTLTDALSYANAEDIDDFAGELGYEKISEALQAYNGCKEAWDKWSEMDLPDNCEDLYDLANHWQDKYEL